jgi:AraC family transcriptional regulator
MRSHALLNREKRHPEPVMEAAPMAPGEGPPPLARRPRSWSTGRRNAACSTEAARIVDYLRRAMERNPEGARAAAFRLVMLLTQPGAAASAGARGGLAPWQKTRVDRYMRKHLDGALHVAELAKQLPLSVSHFCRAFKESFGTTPHLHIIRLRLELAQRLMLTTDAPLSQIAVACGLADQAHLSKLFQREVGETPSSWRRRNLTDAQAARRSRAQRASNSSG